MPLHLPHLLLLALLFTWAGHSTGKQSGQNSVLVVTIDHRELDGSSLRNASHQALSAVINYNYAKLHGYDFLYYHPFLNETSTRLKYPKALVTHGAHEAATSFHPGLGEFRGSSWCRLPVLWQLVQSNADKYDLLLVLDSDLVMSAAQQNVSVETKLAEWQAASTGPQRGKWGPADLGAARIIFFPNEPFSAWEPASGVLLVRPKLRAPSAADMFKDWWDFEWPDKNFALMHDQDVLWRIFQWTPQTVFSLNQLSCAMVAERQFPVDMSIDDWCLRRAWICHVSHSWGKERLRIFHRVLHSEVVHHRTGARLSNETRQVGAFFQETLGVLRASAEVQVDVLAAAEMMERAGERKRIGNHVAQGSVPGSVSGIVVVHPPPPPPPSSPTTSSTAPTPAATEVPDPEERNNEFHNLNPSSVEQPPAERLERFRQGLAAFVQRVKAVQALGQAGGPKAEAAKALHAAFTMGLASHEQFEERCKALLPPTP